MKGQRINLKANLVLNWILIHVQHCWNPKFAYLLFFSLSCENHMLGICYFLVPCEIWMLGVLLSIYISQGMVYYMLTNNHNVKINSLTNNTFSHGQFLKKFSVESFVMHFPLFILYCKFVRTSNERLEFFFVSNEKIILW